MKDENSKKKKSRKKNDTFDPRKNEDIQDLTQKALASFLKERLENNTLNQKNVELLSSLIEEFLASYIVLGYTFDGTPIRIISAHNQQEADSLTTLFNKFITDSLPDEDIQ